MILTATKGKPFSEEFTFKNSKGKLLTVPSGSYALTLERAGWVQEFTDFRVQRNSIVWRMTADETDALKYSTLYFALTFNGTQIARGVLRVN